MSRSLIVLILVSALAPGALLADSTLLYQEGKGQNLVRISQGRVRLDHYRHDQWFLFDSARRELTLVDPAKQEYRVIDEVQIESLRRGVDGMVDQMQAQITKLPPSLQEQARRLMAGVVPEGGGKRSVRLEPSGRRGQAAGFACEFKRAVVDGKERSELCLTSAANLKLPPEDLAALLAGQAFARSLADKASRFVDVDGRVFGDGTQVPLIYTLGGAATRGVLAQLNHTKVEGGLLAVPPGYRQRLLDLPPQ
jgi:hypothetical protein